MSRTARPGRWQVRCLAPVETCYLKVLVRGTYEGARDAAQAHAEQTGHLVVMSVMYYPEGEGGDGDGSTSG